MVKEIWKYKLNKYDENVGCNVFLKHFEKVLSYVIIVLHKTILISTIGRTKTF